LDLTQRLALETVIVDEAVHRMGVICQSDGDDPTVAQVILERT
jgi:hypothetical protein